MPFEFFHFLRCLALISLLLVEGLLFSPVSPALAETEPPLVLTPSFGVENGGLALGANLRDFFLPNLAGEIDAGYGTSLCQNCHLSATTLTGNLVYEIHPTSRLFFYVVAGGGGALADLSSPESARDFWGEIDVGGGGGFQFTRSVGLSLEERWFIPVSGSLAGASPGTLSFDRTFLGIAVSF
ncbi:MAG: hypothetical protein ACP5OP_01875 [Leptospirillia bacterium]